ncbi:MAG: hypothetical protein ACRD2G_10620 [Terriglobia bacterium]
MSNQPDGFETGRGMEHLAWEPLMTRSPNTPASPGMGLFAGPADENDWNAAKASQQAHNTDPHSAVPLAAENKTKIMVARKKEKMEMPICTRVSLSTFRALEVWCDNSFRKRSEVVGIVLERIVEILSQQHCIEQPVEEFVRRLRVGPTP